MNPEEKIAVIGAGSWGTAFANALAYKGLKVTLWARRPDVAETITKRNENSTYLPGTFLSPLLRATSALDEAVSAAGVLVMAVPSHGFREVLTDLIPAARDDAPVVSLAKGLEPESLMRMTEVMTHVQPSSWPERVAVLSGPNLAREIAMGLPAAAVVASPSERTADGLSELFRSPTLRTYSGTDVVGVEVGGIVKNVIAIAVGIAEGMGFGDNTKASVMTRGLAEIQRLGVALGADPQTFMGLAGVGDLICTCASGLSRNHHVGLQLGKGLPIEQVLGEMNQVAEGVKSSRSVWGLATKHGVDMPITESVYRVVHEKQPVSEMVADLLRRVRFKEWD